MNLSTIITPGRIGWFIALVLGPGVVWQCSQRQIENQRLALDTTKQQLDLRGQQQKILEEIIKVMEELAGVDVARQEGKQEIGGVPVSQKRALLKLEIEKLEENHQAIEKNLAQLEKREPKFMSFQYPEPPTGIKIAPQ